MTLTEGTTLVMTTDLVHDAEIPLGNIDSAVWDQDIWKIKTPDSVFSYENNQLKENPRFTDFLDVSSNIRIGYISANDTNKLSLSNFPIGTSILIILDRTTGESYIVRKGLDISELCFSHGNPAWIDQNGKISIISLQK